MREAAVTVHPHPGLFAVDGLEPIRTEAGGPYTVFTPFYRKWSTQPRRGVLDMPGSLRSTFDPAAGR